MCLFCLLFSYYYHCFQLRGDLAQTTDRLRDERQRRSAARESTRTLHTSDLSDNYTRGTV